MAAARTAQIDGSNNVVEIILAPPGFAIPGYVLAMSETAFRGDIYDPVHGTFTTPSIPAPVPAQVTMAQARIALSRAGRLTEVDNLVTSIGGETLLWWDYASIVERSNPLVASLGAALTPPLSSSDIDALFRVAATIS